MQQLETNILYPKAFKCVMSGLVLHYAFAILLLY